MAIAKFTIEMAADLAQLRRDVTNINAVVSQMGGQIAKAYAPGAQALSNLGAAHGQVADQAKLSAMAQQKLARQTQYQNMQLANQLQDFAIQVAGGANPLLAFAQQGSQLSAVYGGAGNALRAVTALITPMNVAFGAGAVAVGALGYAWVKGSEQSAEFRRSLALTGNAAGLTAGSFEAMIDRISASADLGKGKVRDMAQALVSTGRFGPSNIDQATQTAALMAQITGKSAQEVAQEYARMADAPAQYAESANKSLHFLTDAELRHVQMLEATGQRQQAVYEVLMAMARRSSKGIASELGTMDKLLNTLSKQWDKMWDSAFGSGREQTLEQKLAQAIATLERAKQFANDSSASEIGPYGGKRPKAAGVQEAQAAVENYQEQLRLKNQAAAALAQKTSEETAKTESRQLEERLRGANLALQAARQGLQIKRVTLDADAAIWAIESRMALGLDTSPQVQALARQAVAKQELIKLDQQQLQLQGDLQRARASVIAEKPETAIAAAQQEAQIKTRMLEVDAQRVRVHQQLALEQSKIAQAEFDDLERWVDKLQGLESTSREYEFQLGLIGKTTLEAQRLSDVRAIEARHLADIGELERRRDIDETTRAARRQELEDARTRQLDAYAKLHAERYRQIYDAESGVSMAVREYTVRVQQAGDRAREATSNVLQSMEDGITQFVTKGKLDIKGFADTVISEFVRIRIAAPMVQGLAGGDWIGKLFGGNQDVGLGGSGGGTASLSPEQFALLKSANGNAFTASSDRITAFAKGGTFTNQVVSSPTLFKFAKGARMGVMGEAGPEAIMPLQRDAQGRLGVKAMVQGALGPGYRGGGDVVVNVKVVNEGGQPLQSQAATARREADGSVSVDVMVRQVQDALADNVAAGSGSLYHAIGSRFTKTGSR